MLNPFEATERLLNLNSLQLMNFEEKLNMFFIDIDMMPPLMYENYIQARNQDKRSIEALNDLAESADYISFGDCVNKVVREKSAWELLPNAGICLVIAPAVLSAGSFANAKFPQAFGKMMTLKKKSRQIKEIASALAGKVIAPKDSLLNDVIPQLCCQISSRICSQDTNKIKEAINLMDYFNISLNLFKENVLDLCADNKWARAYNEMTTAAKAAFTRLYNKSHAAIVKNKKVKEEAIKDKIDPEAEEMRDDSEEEGEEEMPEMIKQITKSSKKGKGKK